MKKANEPSRFKLSRGSNPNGGPARASTLGKQFIQRRESVQKGYMRCTSGPPALSLTSEGQTKANCYSETPLQHTSELKALAF